MQHNIRDLVSCTHCNISPQPLQMKVSGYSSGDKRLIWAFHRTPAARLQSIT